MDIGIINTVAITSPANPAYRGRPVNHARSLTPDQRERLRAQGYYIQCASPDHWVVNCPFKPYLPRASRANPANRASRASRANYASRASPANRANPANPTNPANLASLTSLARRTRRTNPASHRGADIALLDFTNDNLADALSDLLNITENKEILDRLDWTKYL